MSRYHLTALEFLMGAAWIVIVVLTMWLFSR